MSMLLRIVLPVLIPALALCGCSPESSEGASDTETAPAAPLVVTRSPSSPEPFETDPARRQPASPARPEAGAPGTAPGTSPESATATKPADRKPASVTKPLPAGATFQPVEYVLLETSMGDIVLALDHEHAPVSVANFMGYAARGFYDGTIFHRVIDNFMVQGGGFTPELRQKPTEAPIVNEWRNGLQNRRGTIAMARSESPESATSQFFINVRDNPQLDQAIQGGAGYAVFGNVIAGMDVVDAIRQVETGQKLKFINVPIVDVVIERVSRISETDARGRAGTAG